MKVSNTLLNKTILAVTLCLTLLTPLIASAQSEKTWCSDLYVGDIRVPQQQHLFFFRDILRTNIAAILSDIRGCSFVERNNGLESLLERESQFFSESTFSQITEYTDQFQHQIRWIVLGQLSPTNERNQYSLEVRIVRAASRTSQKRFIHVFRIDEDYDQEVFDREFRSKFLEEMDQMFTFTGYLNSETNVSRRNFRISPEPEHNSLTLDLETGAFEFKIPKHKLEHDTLSVEILGKNIYGILGPSPSINHDSPSNTVRVGRIYVGKTTGQLINLTWSDRPIKCDDFKIQKVTLFSANTFSLRDSVHIDKISSGFRLDLPTGLPNDIEIQVDISSRNYKDYNNPGRFSLNATPNKLTAGDYRPALIRKVIPGLHQLHHTPKLLGPAIIIAEAGALWAYFNATRNASQHKRDASLSTSFITQRELLNAASKDDNIATGALISSIAIYAFNWFHALFLKPCKDGNSISQPKLSPTILAGPPSIGLTISLG